MMSGKNMMMMNGKCKCNIDMKRKVVKISREHAIEIAMNHNCVSLEIAERYTDSELREILNHLKLKANF